MLVCQLDGLFVILERSLRVGILVAEVEGLSQGLGDWLRVAGELGGVEVGEVEVDYVAYCTDGSDNSREMGVVS